MVSWLKSSGGWIRAFELGPASGGFAGGPGCSRLWPNRLPPPPPPSPPLPFVLVHWRERGSHGKGGPTGALTVKKWRRAASSAGLSLMPPLPPTPTELPASGTLRAPADESRGCGRPSANRRWPSPAVSSAATSIGLVATAVREPTSAAQHLRPFSAEKKKGGGEGNISFPKRQPGSSAKCPRQPAVATTTAPMRWRGPGAGVTPGGFRAGSRRRPRPASALDRPGPRPRP